MRRKQLTRRKIRRIKKCKMLMIRENRSLEIKIQVDAHMSIKKINI